MDEGFSRWQPVLLSLLALAYLITALVLIDLNGREAEARRRADGDQTIAREMQAADLRLLHERLQALEERWLLDQHLRPDRSPDKEK